MTEPAMTEIVTALDEPAVTCRLARAARTGPVRRMLLLHGLGGSSVGWRRYSGTAPDEVEVWLADLPWSVGQGSSWTRRTEPGDWLLDAVTRVGAPVDVLVAHSYAANLVLEQLAAGRLDGLSGVVLVSPFYRADERMFDWATIVAYLDGFLPILDEGLRVYSGGALTEDIRDQVARRVREHLGPYGWMRFFDAYLRTPYLAVDGLTVPVLVVGGDRDVAARPADARALASAVPGCRVELIADCGHFPMVERPEPFNRAVNEFLAHLPTRTWSLL
jgi:pimeloyl-ACP methyl ester carboxylesterase